MLQLPLLQGCCKHQNHPDEGIKLVPVDEWSLQQLGGGDNSSLRPVVWLSSVQHSRVLIGCLLIIGLWDYFVSLMPSLLVPLYVVAVHRSQGMSLACCAVSGALWVGHYLTLRGVSVGIPVSISWPCPPELRSYPNTLLWAHGVWCLEYGGLIVTGITSVANSLIVFCHQCIHVHWAKIIAVTVHDNVPQMSEPHATQRLVEEVPNHFISWEVLDYNVPLSLNICSKEVKNIHVSCPFTAWRSPVFF